MKKLMVLATVAAMGAMSAMGDFTYQFDMTFSEAPEGWGNLGYDAIWGLYNSDNQVIVASGMVAKGNDVEVHDGGKLIAERGFDNMSFGNFMQVGEEEFETLQFSVGPWSSKISGTDFPFNFSIQFESMENYDALFGAGTETGLTAFVYDPGQSGETLITIPNIGYSNVDGVRRFGVVTATPEPTSGLLLLLGVAGLAMRRKLNG